MFSSRVTTVSLLALTMSLHVCLLQATANARVLAQKSAAVVTVKGQSKKCAPKLARPGAEALAQSDCQVEQVVHQDSKLSSQDEKIRANSPMPRETFCALLSKYLSLS